MMNSTLPIRLATLVLGCTACVSADANDAATPADATAAVAATKDEAQQAKIKQLHEEAELRNEQLSAQLASMRSEIERMRVEHELAQHKQTQALQLMNAEKSRLEAELALLTTKESAESAPERAKLVALQRAAQLRDAQLNSDLADAAAKQVRTKQSLESAASELAVELAASRATLERSRVAEEVLDMATRTKVSALKREQEQLAAENALIAEKRKADQAKLADDQMRAAALAQTTGAQLQERELEERWRDAINTPVTYTNEPFKDGVITISDRKIDLNGPIMSGSASYVCDRLDYFNNQDRTKPIFVVIDNSPGGSVMQGYRILKAIETSDAPVHVIVKSFAASMAATIATLAPHSYAYPNAIILHHQMSSSASGNMTDIEQEVKMMKEWERRLADPIAKKMGISLEEFRAKMYSARKSGDWDEFADKAVALKWIDHLVNEIREEGVRKKPSSSGNGGFWMSALKTDEQGKPYFALPPLEPYDCYFMINPRGFYRVEGR